MSAIECAGKTIQIDEHGFLADLNDWNEDVAQVLATREGVETLSREQMEIISFMRKYYLRNKVFPILNQLCKVVHQSKECVNEQFINPEKAWKIAGLPKLDGIHFITMDGINYKMEECC
ncbi:MAG: TusE/DsrC/DsvC family sulfur relay protein [Proteobacteria bacterium]|nr:TusE/DsrC/DsvC family sulfur relay protein [Pseudomonadota bacterium]MBU1058108.1 TusE/DsrC/DsvC family sulfur relay protein [Pseudomonadota bacterium]